MNRPAIDTLTPAQQEILAQFVGQLRRQVPGLLAVYRFGSWGTGVERRNSDIDIAILAERAVDSTLRWELAAALGSHAGRDVDLVDLATVSTVMRAQVISRGSRVFCADESRCVEFEDFVFSDYARLNEERRGILDDIRARGSVYGR